MVLDDWEAEVTFKIHGSGKLGADGIGIWYTPDHSFAGPAYGTPAKWNGLLVALDTFDNTAGRSNPTLSVLMNDGTKTFNPADNGRDLTVGSCRFNFRNTGRYSKVIITYHGSTGNLQVSYAEDADNPLNTHTCYTGKATLPKNNLFGITAATGDLSDNHDVKSFIVRDLSNVDTETLSKQRNEELFREYQEKIKQYQQQQQQQQQQPQQQQQQPQVSASVNVDVPKSREVPTPETIKITETAPPPPPTTTTTTTTTTTATAKTTATTTQTATAQEVKKVEVVDLQINKEEAARIAAQK